MTPRQWARLINGSKRYEFTGTVLTITDYYDSRNTIQLDLGKLTPDMLADLQPEPEDEDWQDEPYC